MPGSVAVDAGPLIALFDRGDRQHESAMEFVRSGRHRLVTNLAVVTEVTCLLDFSVTAQTDFLEWVSAGGAEVANLESADFGRIIALMRKYGDLPMDFADAAIVAMCERLGIREVATIDQDFLIYRYRDRLTFSNVFPRQ